jgi:phospholipid-translocating ATPase
LGITAVEDELQESVERVIKKLRAAGIKTWILTGDKMETTLHIAHKCDLTGLTGQEKSGRIETSISTTIETDFIARFAEIKEKYPNGCELLAIDGVSLSFATKYPELEEKFFLFASQCNSVIFSRLWP